MQKKFNIIEEHLNVKQKFEENNNLKDMNKSLDCNFSHFQT